MEQNWNIQLVWLVLILVSIPPHQDVKPLDNDLTKIN